MVAGMYGALSHRVQRLEHQRAIKSANVEEPLSMHFAVAASCPPSMIIHIRGGNIWEGRHYPFTAGDGYYVEPTTCDFSLHATIFDYDGNFTNANYFMGIVLGLEQRANNVFQATGADVEHATAAEAEAHIENVALLEGPWDEFLPLYGIVLRNNGTTGVNAAILPIDAANRGGSYLWKDLRPRHYVTYTIYEPD